MRRSLVEVRQIGWEYEEGSLIIPATEIPCGRFAAESLGVRLRRSGFPEALSGAVPGLPRFKETAVRVALSSQSNPNNGLDMSRGAGRRPGGVRCGRG